MVLPDRTLPVWENDYPRLRQMQQAMSLSFFDANSIESVPELEYICQYYIRDFVFFDGSARAQKNTLPMQPGFWQETCYN